MKKTTLNREAIIAEYLTGETTFRQLSAKHGVDFRTIHYWVSSYKGKKHNYSKKRLTNC